MNPDTIYKLPQDLHPGWRQTDVLIRPYTPHQARGMNRILLHRPMINLIVRGVKTILYPQTRAIIEAGELVLLSTGTCLTSEVQSVDTGFSSIVIYFDHSVWLDFFTTYTHVLGIIPLSQGDKQPFVKFEQDRFIQHYVRSLQLLLETPRSFTAEFQRLKLEELLLYLAQQYPRQLQTLQLSPDPDHSLQLKQVVETYATTPITLDELAFLCHCSLSTFKRRFSALYGTTPHRWLLEQKMHKAAALLQLPNESPASVYPQLGYENHSSFSKAFKCLFGLSPKTYQQQHLTE